MVIIDVILIVKKNISKKQASNNSITEKHNDNIIEGTVKSNPPDLFMKL